MQEIKDMLVGIEMDRRWYKSGKIRTIMRPSISFTTDSLSIKIMEVWYRWDLTVSKIVGDTKLLLYQLMLIQ
jgi:hypothetical protein